jgi:hypothetical protein
MKASDLVKGAATIATGAVAYDVATDAMDDDGLETVENIAAMGVGLVGGAFAGKLIGSAMDSTGISNAIDDIFSF